MSQSGLPFRAATALLALGMLVLVSPVAGAQQQKGEIETGDGYYPGGALTAFLSVGRISFLYVYSGANLANGSTVGSTVDVTAPLGAVMMSCFPGGCSVTHPTVESFVVLPSGDASLEAVTEYGSLSLAWTRPHALSAPGTWSAGVIFYLLLSLDSWWYALFDVGYNMVALSPGSGLWRAEVAGELDETPVEALSGYTLFNVDGRYDVCWRPYGVACVGKDWKDWAAQLLHPRGRLSEDASPRLSWTDLTEESVGSWSLKRYETRRGLAYS